MTHLSHSLLFVLMNFNRCCFCFQCVCEGVQHDRSQPRWSDHWGRFAGYACVPWSHSFFLIPFFPARFPSLPCSSCPFVSKILIQCFQHACFEFWFFFFFELRNPEFLILIVCEGQNPSKEDIDNMLGDAPGPINFAMFLTLFGERMSGLNIDFSQNYQPIMWS